MQRETTPDLDVDVELTRLVRQIRARSLRTLGTIHPRLDYSTFVLLLAIIDEPGGARASDLAEAMQVHKSTVSRAVRSLTDMGLVDRAPDPDDGRSQVLTPTPEARERVAAYRAKAHEVVAAGLADWDQDDLRTLATLLGRLNGIFTGMD